MGQQADFKLIIFVNSDVAPVNLTVNPPTTDNCGPGEQYNTHNLFAAPVYKAANYQWAVNPYNSNNSPTSWLPWGSSSLDLNTSAWSPQSFYFEVWDTNPVLGANNTATLTRFGFACSSSDVFKQPLSSVANYPPNDPRLFSAFLVPTNLQSQPQPGVLSMSYGPAGSTTTSLSAEACSVWPAVYTTLTFDTTPPNPLKVQIAAFIQIQYVVTDATTTTTTTLNFTSDPDMILDAI